MKKYHIYHPQHGSINYACATGCYNYEHVATVEADSIQDAFVKAQNDFNELYERLSLRSTCVGDLIRVDDEIHPYMVMEVGFEPVQFTDMLTGDDGPIYDRGEYIEFEETKC